MEVVQNVTSALFPINGSQLIQPVMLGFTSLLLLGSVALQSVLGRPNVSRERRDGLLLSRTVTDFIATEEKIALEQLLCNIGSGGCKVQGAGSGLVIASPSKNDPDCKLFIQLSKS
jgi:glucoamylase